MRHFILTKDFFIFLFLFLVGIGVIQIGNPYMVVATGAYFCLILGLLYKKKLYFHVSFMLLGIITDLGMVLFLEINRTALNTVWDGVLSLGQWIHVGSSCLAVLFYLPTAFLGFWRLKKGRFSPRSRKAHIIFGLSAFCFRSIGWIFMFSFLGS